MVMAIMGMLTHRASAAQEVLPNLTLPLGFVPDSAALLLWKTTGIK